MTVKMLVWAAMEIVVDLALLYVLWSDKLNWFRRAYRWIISGIIVLDILGIVDWTVWRFLQEIL